MRTTGAVLLSALAVGATAVTHCSPGYTLLGTGCVACADGTFKPFAGNGACTPCPVGASGATEDHQSCMCTSATPVARRLGTRRLLSAEQDVWEDAMEDMDFEDDVDFSRMLAGGSGSFGSGDGSGVGSGDGGSASHGSGDCGTGSGSCAGPTPAPSLRFFFDGVSCVAEATTVEHGACGVGETTNPDDATGCVACAANTFKAFEGPQACAPCPAGSVSSATLSTCTCPESKQSRRRLSSHSHTDAYFNGTTCGGQEGCAVGDGLTDIGDGSGLKECTPCATDTFQAVEGAAAACAAVAVCPAGVQSAAWSASADTNCTACPAGTFKTAAGNGAGLCVAHQVCPAGTEPSPVGNATTDTTCTACPANTFKAAAGGAACLAHKTCGVGESGVGATAGTATTDKKCVPCAAGSTFKSTTGDAACAPCTAPYSNSTVCAPGAPFEQACTTTTDKVCPELAATEFEVKSVSFGTPACAGKTRVWVGGVTEAVATITVNPIDNPVAVTFQAIDSANSAAIGAPITVTASRITDVSYTHTASAKFLLAKAFVGKNIKVIATATTQVAGKIPGSANKMSDAKEAFAPYKMDPIAAFGSCKYDTGSCDTGSQVRADAICRNVVCGADTKVATLVPCLADGARPPSSSRPCFKPCSATSLWMCKEGSSYVQCRPDGWSACTATCGGGTQTRDVQWMKFENGAWASGTGVEDIVDKPASTRTCGLQACETYTVETSAYSACPRTCKVGATPLWKFRSVKCMATTAKVQVSMSRCDTSAMSNADLTTIANCAPGLPACATPFRTYGRWGRCSVACGGGVASRKVQCMSATGVAQADDTICASLKRETVPASVQVAADTNKDTQRKCNTNACTVTSWRIGPFGACSKSCANKGIPGVSRRSVTCQEYDPATKVTATVADSTCTATAVAAIIGAKPSTETVCGTAACDPCEDYICGYGGTCSSPGGVRTCTCTDTAECGVGCQVIGAGTSLPKCEKASVPTCSGGQVLKLNKSACFTGFVYKNPSAAGFLECVGANAVLDGAGTCCVSGTVDVCNVCDGTAVVVDAYGTCCASELDAGGVCCSGIVDSCGVCDGSNECKVVVKAVMPVPVVASQSPVISVNYASAATSQRKAYDLAAKPGIAEICAGGRENANQIHVDEVLVVGARRLRQMWRQAIRRRLAATAIEPTFSVLPPPSSDSGAGISLTSVTESFAEAATSGADSPFKPTEVPQTATAGVCGNQNCETGERCDGTNAATCCKADCPLELKVCPIPAGSSEQCGGQGTCMSASGACKCFTAKGFTGADCSGCTAGFVKGAIVDGKVTCDAKVVRVAVGETASPTPAPYVPPRTSSPTPVPTPAAPTPAPWPTDKRMVVKFMQTVSGFSKATFNADVQAAYIAAIANQADVTVETVKIFRIADGATAAVARRLAVAQVSFDIEIAVTTLEGASALQTKITAITDAAILAQFKTELTAVGEAIPAGLAVVKAVPVIAEATSTIDWALSGALLAATLLVTFILAKWRNKILKFFGCVKVPRETYCKTAELTQI